MQFKHPEILYALLLLLIPIIIHLFQLRRFQKTAFTNVAFLKKVTIQTRKSAQLKKWLTLLLRMAAIACIVIAFAQPFSASKTALNTNKETVVYLDNSFSMQTKGVDGPLLQRAIQRLYELPKTEKISFFTNDHIFRDVSEKTFKTEILKTDFSATQITRTQALLKASQLFSKDKNTEKRFLYISDFQQKEGFPKVSKDIIVDAVALQPTKATNISIDTAYISNKDASKITLTVALSAQNNDAKNVPVSLYNKNVLIAKTAVDFSETIKATTTFDLDKNIAVDGVIEIEDTGLMYDNKLYFNIHTNNKIQILAINEANGTYLEKLFNENEFVFTPQSYKNLDYNTIPKQNLIILNGLENISDPLKAALLDFSKNGGSICIIAHAKANLADYNTLLPNLRLGTLDELVNDEKQITNIVFSHPLYKNVFEKQVVNFQYPKVNSYYTSTLNAGAALRFADGKPFIIQTGNHFMITAPLDTENTNFKSSPLIVPTFYNMASQSLPLPKLYYNIGTRNIFAVPVSLQQDEILSLKDSITSFIPLQQSNANTVTITTDQEPQLANIYGIYKQTAFIEHVSFNYNRTESQLRYSNPNDWTGVTVHDSITNLFDTIKKDNTIHEFWKWFAIAAFLFLVAELLVLKFYKK